MVHNDVRPCCIGACSIIIVISGLVLLSMSMGFMNINKYTEEECIISGVDTPTRQPYPNNTDQWVSCDCGKRCVSTTPCERIYVDIKDGSQHIIVQKHTISERSDGTQCTSKQEKCDENGHYERMIGAQNNVQPFIDLMNTNKTITCYINGDRNKAYLNNDPDWTNFIIACSLLGVGILGVLLFSECCGKCKKDKDAPKKSVDDDDDDDMEKGCLSKLNCWGRQQDV